MLPKTQWTSIIDKVTTGETLSNQLNTAFSNVDDAIDTLNEVESFTIGLQDVTSKLPGVSLSSSVSAPAYDAGRVFYTDKKFKYYDGYSQEPRTFGHSIYMEVINTSGADISKGKAVRHNGVNGGLPQITLAKADTLVNATILGITAMDIPINQKGIICILGEIKMDTSALPAGVPLYLSETVDGDFTSVRPPITTQVGGVTIQSISGSFIVSINNTTVTTSYIAVLSNLLNPVISLTTSSAVVTNYFNSLDVILTATTSTGDILIPYSGIYKFDIAFDMQFASAVSSRTFIVELYNTTTSTIVATFNIDIPKDSTVDSRLLSKVLSVTANHKYVLRVKGSTAFNITLNSIDLSVNSMNV